MRINVFVLALLFTLPLCGQSGSHSPVELGQVSWLRDFDAGLSRARKENKPVFLLFQEVPGCATCQRYGKEVLSHPLIVEAVESLFIPVAIYNNKGGKDAEVLKAYGEPSWNNPVVRLVGADRKDLVPRISGNYSPLGVVQSMIYALQRSDREVPAYLSLLREELDARTRGTEVATLSMYCFWTGEKQYGQLDGVISTEPGYMHGREVVKVEYDPKAITLEELLRSGRQSQCADQVYIDDPSRQATAAKIAGREGVRSTGEYRRDKDNKYYLSRSPYRFVPMTPLQATRVNSLIGQGKSPDQLLSPRQISLLRQVKSQPAKAWKSAIGKDLALAWAALPQGADGSLANEP